MLAAFRTWKTARMARRKLAKHLGLPPRLAAQLAIINQFHMVAIGGLPLGNVPQFSAQLAGLVAPLVEGAIRALIDDLCRKNDLSVDFDVEQAVKGVEALRMNLADNIESLVRENSRQTYSGAKNQGRH